MFFMAVLIVLWSSASFASARSPNGDEPTGIGPVISDPNGTTTIQDRYVVQNGVYNDPGSGQSIAVSPTGFTVTAEANTAPITGAPLAYPSVYLGAAWGTTSPNSPLPEPLSQINTAVSSVEFTFPPNGQWDAAYDIWLNPTPIRTGVNQQEIMIMFNRAGPIQPYGLAGFITIDGHDFAVYHGHNGYNHVVWYVASAPISSWRNMNVLSFIKTAEILGPVTNSWYLTSIQAGFEIWNGGVGATVNSFSASINGVD